MRSKAGATSEKGPRSELDRALIRSVSKGRLREVRELLENGADPNAPVDEWTGKVLHLASLNDRPGVLRALARGGAKLHAKNREGKTPLDVASARGHSRVVRELLAAEPEPDVQALESRSRALIAAALAGQTEVMPILIRAGADVDFVSPEGWTPLAAARRQGHSETVVFLKSAGATAEGAFGATMHFFSFLRAFSWALGSGAPRGATLDEYLLFPDDPEQRGHEFLTDRWCEVLGGKRSARAALARLTPEHRAEVGLAALVRLIWRRELEWEEVLACEPCSHVQGVDGLGRWAEEILGSPSVYLSKRQTSRLAEIVRACDPAVRPCLPMEAIEERLRRRRFS